MKRQEALGIFTGYFNDKRTAQRSNIIFEGIVHSGSSVINRTTNSHADKIGAYRMLNNKRCMETEIKTALYANCQVNAQNSKHLLCIQDTTAINYTSHSKRIKEKDKDLGIGSNADDIFLFCHPTIVIDATTHFPLGFSHLNIYNRDWETHGETRSATAYKQLPIEEKESFRWIESIRHSEELLSKNSMCTYISDRESDIYELLCLSHDNVHLLIRSSWDRTTDEKGICLIEKVLSSGVRESYEIEIKHNANRQDRKALLDLYYCPVRLLRPQKRVGKMAESVDMYCVYVKERAESVPQGEEPIEWRLLTTHIVEDNEMAMQCVEWYKQRWYIEELFRVLKSKGFDIESAQLETGVALKKLILFSLQACINVMMMKLAFDAKAENIEAKNYLTTSQIELLRLLIPTLEGKTEKQKNPFIPTSLPWAAWCIAKLGAWVGYASQSPPGYITFKKGYDKFMVKLELFELMKKG